MLPSTLITVFHGAKLWTPRLKLRAPSIDYMISRGKSINEATDYANGLLMQLNDFYNLPLLNIAMYNAQVSGYLSPFVSTSRNRNIARSFAISDGNPGFILTIRGPEDIFYDFNKIREKVNIPHRPEFQWLEELGIPIMMQPPFELLKVEKVFDLKEISNCIFEKKV